MKRLRKITLRFKLDTFLGSGELVLLLLPGSAVRKTMKLMTIYIGYCD